MKQRYYVGIDVSKAKVDIAILNEAGELVLEEIVKNQQSTLKGFFQKFLKKEKRESEQLLVCCENTGIYNHPLEEVCLEMEIFLWVETALKIKKASSDLRGKSDRKDAYRIADYAKRYEDKKVAFLAKNPILVKLEDLLKARETIIDQILAMEQQLSESEVMNHGKYLTLRECYKLPLRALKAEQSRIEDQIKDISGKNPQIQKNLELLTSIPGIGQQNALQFIIHTANFTRFMSAKHLACYAGVAPFDNESGTIKKRARISKLANQKLKKLLHMAAMACVRVQGELKEYFIRKVQQGKNKMAVLNAIRNKLVHRMFAVIKRQKPYLSNIKCTANAAVI